MARSLLLGSDGKSQRRDNKNPVPEKHSLSLEERECEESFYNNTKRKDDGRFVVTIPLKSDPSVLGDSYGIAKRRFLSLEKRFELDHKFKSTYLDFMSIPMTIPRLQLCGALLGSRFCTEVKDSLTLPAHRVRYWCESTIVLGWLSRHPQQLKPVFRNRFNEIQGISSDSGWRYVPSMDNPAVLISRGLKADLISASALWWSGPQANTRSNLKFPFFNSSVDYGPILISDRKGRGSKLIKSYLCIFVCMATKAVHLELVTDLSKEAYKAALNRFVSRRGRPRTILSDNGTNFVGACNELYAFLQGSDVAFEIAQEGIEFRFVPAYSPHFNGLAEAAVRSAKHHLKRLLQLTHFTYEEMATCVTQIEAILNSRPLTPLSTNPLDFSALTPSHFLIGRSLMSVPNPQVTDASISRLERYQRVECIKQHFWKRFNIEYISNLQQKTKWPASTNGDIALGSLVLIKDKALPPLCWSLGRVAKVYPGSDGVTRVAELKTKRGTIRRGFNNICPLPL